MTGDMRDLKEILEEKQDLTPVQIQELIKEWEKTRKEKIEKTLSGLGGQIIQYCEKNDINLKDGMRIAGLSEGVRKVPIKYIDPKDQKNVWAGRGRTPKWYKTRLGEGYTEVDLLVNKKDLKKPSR